MENPIVSICCITYNHVNYISECIEGFLIQRTTFPVEILIFDDASTDGTQEIVRKYASKDIRIKTFLQSENQWSKQKYGLIDWLFPAAQGKYIAICEGDDYWTDPFRLQKQVDFLEQNKDYKFSMGIVEILIEKTGKIIRKKDHVNPARTESYLLKDYMRAPFSHTSSFLFRNEGIHFPNWKNDIFAGDQLLVIMITGLNGKIKYHNEVFSIYRLNTGSITYNSDLDELKRKGDLFLKKIDEYTNYSFTRLILYRKILHHIYFFTHSKSCFVKYTSKLLFNFMTKLLYKL